MTSFRVSGALVALAALVVGGGLVTLAACSDAQLTGPTGGDDAGVRADACSTAARVDCAADAATTPTCTADPQSPNASIRRIPAGTSAAVGCVVNVPDPVPNELGECLIDVACTCTGALNDAGADAAPTPWVCKQ